MYKSTVLALFSEEFEGRKFSSQAQKGRFSHFKVYQEMSMRKLLSNDNKKIQSNTGETGGPAQKMKHL